MAANMVSHNRAGTRIAAHSRAGIVGSHLLTGLHDWHGRVIVLPLPSPQHGMFTVVRTAEGFGFDIPAELLVFVDLIVRDILEPGHGHDNFSFSH